MVNGLSPAFEFHASIVRTDSSKFQPFNRARLGGRAMRDEDQPKYLNSPETPIYRKTSVLYNLHRARDGMRRSNRVVLVEGYMDVIGVYSAGVHNVVASCGTSLTNTQVRAIKRHSERIVVNFDSDTAGANATEKYIKMLLDEGLRVRVLELGGDLDPDEFVKASGAEVYRQRLEKAPVYYHWLADRARQKFDFSTVEGRMDAFKSLTPHIQSIADRLERFAVANDVADYLGIDEKLVRDHFSKGSAERTEAPRRYRFSRMIFKIAQHAFQLLLHFPHFSQLLFLPFRRQARGQHAELMPGLLHRRQPIAQAEVARLQLANLVRERGKAFLHQLSTVGEQSGQPGPVRRRLDRRRLVGDARWSSGGRSGGMRAK